MFYHQERACHRLTPVAVTLTQESICPQFLVISHAQLPLIMTFLASCVRGFAFACCRRPVLHHAIAQDIAVHIICASSSAFVCIVI